MTDIVNKYSDGQCFDEQCFDEQYYRPDHYYDYPLVFEHASGSTIVDTDGNKYTDLFSAMGSVSCGHGNELVKNKILKQLDKITATSFFPSDTQLELINQLNKILPTQHKIACLFSTGSESTEYAIRLARVTTGKTKIISCKGHFHGKTHGVMHLYEHFPECYGNKAANHSASISLDIPETSFKAELLQAIDQDTAAIILEPIPGMEGGRIIPKEIISVINNCCKEKKVLIISDEILTGLFRCGEWFLSPETGLNTDILCFGKSMGNGLPITAVACKQQLSEYISRAIPGSTFSGNPVSCAAATGVIEFLKRPEIGENVKRIERNFYNHFDTDEFRQLNIKTNGKGALLGITPENLKPDDIRSIYIEILKNGVIVSHSKKTLRVTPPLTINVNDFQQALIIIGEAIIKKHRFKKKTS